MGTELLTPHCLPNPDVGSSDGNSTPQQHSSTPQQHSSTPQHSAVAQHDQHGGTNKRQGTSAAGGKRLQTSQTEILSGALEEQSAENMNLRE